MKLTLVEAPLAKRKPTPAASKIINIVVKLLGNLIKLPPYFCYAHSSKSKTRIMNEKNSCPLCLMVRAMIVILIIMALVFLWQSA